MIAIAVVRPVGRSSLWQPTPLVLRFEGRTTTDCHVVDHNAERVHPRCIQPRKHGT